jgi:hypothetical protein
MGQEQEMLRGKAGGVHIQRMLKFPSWFRYTFGYSTSVENFNMR